MKADGSIQTVSGRRVSAFEPEPADIDAADIAHALANQCRFGGHSRVFYSVAQHSCVVADLVAARGASPDDVLWALLHDASEAYLVDLPHPLKHRTPLGELYREVEQRLQRTICERFDLPFEPPVALKAVDRSVLATERRELLGVAWHWPELEGVEPVELELAPWDPPRAEAEFLARLESLEASR